MHLFGTISGEYKVCCFAEYAPEVSVLGTHKDTFTDVWNGEAYRKIRKSFLEGKNVPECEWACFNKEKLGSKSHRQIMNENYKDLAVLQSMTEDDGSLNSFPVYLDVRFGNTCNFRCRMCGPESSTSWYREMPTSLKGAIDKYTDNEVFWNNIDYISTHLRDIYFAGGEPFVQDGHYKLLNYLIEKGISSRISLSYNSNLSYTKFKKHDIKQLWQNFKHVKVWPSCEGFGDKAEYSRKGLSWNTFQENVNHFKEYIQTISSVISIYSISSMPDLLLWSKERGVQLHGTTLIMPNHMSVTCLPKEAKRKINHQYKDFLLEHYSKFSNDEINMIKSWLTYMNSKDDSNLLPEFKSFNVKYDLTRNESFESVYPEYASWYINI